MTDGNMGVGKSNVLTKKSNMKKIKKSDWVIVRLLIEGARISPRECFTSPDYVRAVVYLVNKYGLQPTSDAFDVIQKEKGLRHDR
jgi:hypothetical protein